MGIAVLRASPPDGAQSRIVRNSVRRAILVGRAGVAPSIGDARLDDPISARHRHLGPPMLQSIMLSRCMFQCVERLINCPAPETVAPLPSCAVRQASTGSVSCLPASPCSGIQLQLPGPSQPVLCARGRPGCVQGSGVLAELQIEVHRGQSRRPEASF